MSPHAARARTAGRYLILNVAVPLSAVIGALGWFSRNGASVLDARYLHAEEYRLTHRTDSLVYDARLGRVEGQVSALYRACQRKGECP